MKYIIDLKKQKKKKKGMNFEKKKKNAHFASSIQKKIQFKPK